MSEKIARRAVPVIARVLQSVRDFDPNVSEAVYDTGINHLVDSDHGCVLKVVHPMNQTETNFEQEAQGSAEFLASQCCVFFSFHRLLRTSVCFDGSL